MIIVFCHDIQVPVEKVAGYWKNNTIMNPAACASVMQIVAKFVSSLCVLVTTSAGLIYLVWNEFGLNLAVMLIMIKAFSIEHYKPMWFLHRDQKMFNGIKCHLAVHKSELWFYWR